MFISEIFSFFNADWCEKTAVFCLLLSDPWFRKIIAKLGDDGALEACLNAVNVVQMKVDLEFTLINFKDDTKSIRVGKDLQSVVVLQRTEQLWFL